MSSPSSTDALSAPTAPPARAGLNLWRRWKEFHAHHGIWAFGIKLLRRWSIRAKVLLLLAIIALPVVPLSIHVIGENKALVLESARHMAAVKLTAAASALGTELATQAQVQASGRAIDSGLLVVRHDAYLAALAQAQASGVGPLPSLASGEALIRRAARESGLSVEGRADATGQAIDGLLRLRRDAVTTGGVVMTEDLTVNRTAGLALELMPDLQIGIGRLRGLLAPPRGERAVADPHGQLVVSAGLLHELQRLTDEAELQLAALPAQVLPTLARGLPRTRAMLAVARLSLLGPTLAEDLNPLLLKLSESRTELVEAREQLLDEALRQVQRRHEDARSGALAMAELLGICLLVAGYLGYTFFLVMRGGLGALNQQMNRMAQGDLSARPAPLGGDEVAATMLAMTTSLARLSDLLASVRHGVSAVTQASQQVALGNAELSQRNRKGADGLDGVAGSVHRYTEQLEACGREIDKVVASVQQLRLEAARNRKQTGRLQERLGSLRGRSREIGDIVRLIDAIAFRTNILALNASVEASKAGEAGRGFAVVAQEVRSLAMRSAESAKRIDEIIGRSTEDIERSGELADEAGRSLGALDEYIDGIHGSMQGVADLTRQGEHESATILEEVRRLQESSGKNQQLVEQLALAADALRSQGERLSQGIGQFTLS